jgi:hypothetical protein
MTLASPRSTRPRASSVSNETRYAIPGSIVSLFPRLPSHSTARGGFPEPFQPFAGLPSAPITVSYQRETSARSATDRRRLVESDSPSPSGDMSATEGFTRGRCSGAGSIHAFSLRSPTASDKER